MNSLSPDHRRAFEDYMDAICRHYQAAGMAVTVFDDRGDTCYRRICGVRDVERQLPIDDQTVFGLASVTKSFVTLSVLQLQERGLLTVDDPISRYLPEFSNCHQAPVLIRHLLSHSAGFFPLPRTLLATVAEDMGLTEDRDGDLSLNAALTQQGTEIVCRQLDAQTQEHGLIGPPGRHMSYCNDGFGLLSEIVRRVSGATTFADYVRKNLLEPLGMTRSSAEYLRPRQQDNVSILYQVKDGQLVGSTDSYEFAFVLPGAGAMKSTLWDMQRYGAMYLRQGVGCNGSRVVSEASIRHMFQPQIALPTCGHYCFGLETGQHGRLAVRRHGGSQPGVSSHLYLVPEAGRGAVVLCNTSKVPVGLIAQAAMSLVLGGDPVPPRPALQEIPWSRETMEAAQGIYASAEGTNATVELTMANGQLTMLQNGTPVAFTMTGEDRGIIRDTFQDSMTRLFRTEAGKVFAVNSGDRLLPRADASQKHTKLHF